MIHPSDFAGSATKSARPMNRRPSEVLYVSSRFPQGDRHSRPPTYEHGEPEAVVRPHQVVRYGREGVRRSSECMPLERGTEGFCICERDGGGRGHGVDRYRGEPRGAHLFGPGIDVGREPRAKYRRSSLFRLAAERLGTVVVDVVRVRCSLGSEQ
jgi:hypothetical protein